MQCICPKCGYYVEIHPNSRTDGFAQCPTCYNVFPYKFYDPVRYGGNNCFAGNRCDQDLINKVQSNELISGILWILLAGCWLVLEQNWLRAVALLCLSFVRLKGMYQIKKNPLKIVHEIENRKWLLIIWTMTIAFELLSLSNNSVMGFPVAFAMFLLIFDWYNRDLVLKNKVVFGRGQYNNDMMMSSYQNIQQNRYCTNCGSLLSPQDSFCGRCGKRCSTY